jgi:serine/threonine protein kinase/Tol biopolymer transport system component
MNSGDGGTLAYQLQHGETKARTPWPGGTAVGPYRILSLLASGGMGDVYRARDERLGREVALKVLPEALTDDRERVDRFAQEAKSASALNHPHIVAIYEIGQARPTPVVQAINAKERPRDVHYIAMELIEGETLRDFLWNKPLLTRRLEILAETAEGLGKAHAAGIVHRDLKPDNVMISAEGYAKVVDFGLAKLVEPAHGWNPIGADSPTMRAITQQGELIGTAGYMSPEQILGKSIDQRSDIFSFGCMLHEAITGQQPFSGASFVDTLHEVLHAVPAPVEHPNPTVQHELQRIVTKCLVKDREHRYQSIRDVALDLRALNRDLDNGTAAQRSLGSRPWLAVAAVVVIAVVAGWLLHLRQEGAPPATPRRFSLQRITTNGRVGHLAISPDGRFAAYSANDEEKGEGVWLQQIATGSSVTVVPAAEKSYYAGLAFTSDSNYLLPTRYDGSIIGSVLRVPILGGTVTKLISDADTPVSVSPDGMQLAVTRDVLEKGESRLLLTAADGSHERLLTKLPLPQGAMSPVWSPDGRRIAAAHGQSLYLVDAATGTKESVPLTGWHGSIRDVAWTADGKALLVSAVDDRSAGHFQILRIDLPGGAVTNVTDDDDDYAEPRQAGRSIAAIQIKRQATLWVASLGTPAEQLTRGLGTSDGIGGVAWTRDGRIIYTSSAAGSIDLWIADADGTSPRQLTNDDQLESRPLVTPDGAALLFTARSHGAATLWRMNFDGSQRRELATASMIYDFTVTPDSKRVIYASGDESVQRSTLLSVPIDGGAPARLALGGVFLHSLRVTPDGATVLFTALEERSTKLFRLPIAGGTPAIVNAAGANDADISPDGKLLAYAHEMEGQAVLTIAPLDGGKPLQTLDRGGRMYRWTPDGKGIVYIKKSAKGDNLMLQPLAGGACQTLTTFADGSIANYQWSADGKRILLTHYVQTRDVVLLTGM